jgi:hypothetical protein
LKPDGPRGSTYSATANDDLDPEYRINVLWTLSRKQSFAIVSELFPDSIEVKNPDNRTKAEQSSHVTCLGVTIDRNEEVENTRLAMHFN